MTAKQKVYKYFVKERKYPSMETWLSWGYNRTYYYEVKKKWDNGENFNIPEKKEDQLLLEGVRSLANKDGVVAIFKGKDMSRLADWITKIRSDDKFDYYVVY